VLVTGGAGFIGSNFVRRSVDGTLSGISEITVLDKLTYAGTLTNLSGLPQGSYKFVQGDICDVELVNSLAKENDAIVNFAAESHVDRSITGAKDFIVTNVLGTQNLLDAALHNEGKTFVQVSTDEVYGSISDGSWSEDFPLLPNSPY
jgi:dTDP-glucose 4,6-dehydratase